MNRRKTVKRKPKGEEESGGLGEIEFFEVFRSESKVFERLQGGRERQK